jgi:hypothetical protein
MATHIQNLLDPADDPVKENWKPLEPRLPGWRKREAMMERVKIPATTASEIPMGIL